MTRIADGDPVLPFTRDRGVWRLGGVDQPLDLRQLLSNLGTYAIHETKGLRRSDEASRSSGSDLHHLGQHVKERY